MNDFEEDPIRSFILFKKGISVSLQATHGIANLY
jgi:hypothetical protein